MRDLVLWLAQELVERKDAVRVDFPLEPGQEALAAGLGTRSAVGRPGPRDVGADPTALCWRAHGHSIPS